MTSTTTTYYFDDEGDVVKPMTTAAKIPAGIGIGILTVIGIAGNAMAVVAYCKDKYLNSAYDFFICSLAVTDLLICSIDFPVYAVFTLMDFTWPFGYTFCKVWSVVDFTLCFESILLMLILSVDRLLIITYGPIYLQRMTKHIANVVIAISWPVAFAVYGPAIIGWNHWVGYSSVEDMNCDVEFANDFVFTTVTAIVEFILPFVCLTTLNIVIYHKIRQRLKVKPSVTLSLAGQPPSTADENQTVKPNSSPEKAEENVIAYDDNVKKLENGFNRNLPQTSIIQSKTGNDSNNVMTEIHTNATKATKQTRKLIKTAKFLAALVVAFLVMWAPYTVATIIISFCEDCVNKNMYKFFIWLLWMKSPLNPFLYAFHSPRYRKHFIKYITLNYRMYRGKPERLTK